MLSAARDALLHVREVVLHLLHLDRLLSLGHGDADTKSANLDEDRHTHADKGGDNGKEEPEWTMTIETLSPRTFSNKVNKPLPSMHEDVVTDRSAQSTQVCDHDAKTADKDEPSGAIVDANVAPCVTQGEESPKTDAVARQPESPPASTFVSERFPHDLSPKKGAVDTDDAALRQPEEEEPHLERTRSELNLLALASASLEAAGMGSKVPSDSDSLEKKPAFGEDLERVSIESNATDDTEEDRMRALDDSSVQQGRRSSDNGRRSLNDRPPSGAKRSHRWTTKLRPKRAKSDSADVSSSDDEQQLQSELYASSPRCMPQVNRASFTSI
jgi:hypothetical protein